MDAIKIYNAQGVALQKTPVKTIEKEKIKINTEVYMDFVNNANITLGHVVRVTDHSIKFRNTNDGIVYEVSFKDITVIGNRVKVIH